MHWQITSLYFSTVFELVLLLLVRGHLRTSAAKPFCLGLALKALWAFNYALDLGSSSLEEKLFLFQLRSSFLCFYALVWFETAYRLMRGRAFLRGWTLAASLIVPLISVALVWLPGPGQNPVFRHSFWLDTTGSVPVVHFSNGPWATVFNAYLFGFGAAIFILLFRTRLLTPWERRGRLLFASASLIGIIANALYTLNLSPVPGLNLAPLLFPLTSTLLACALIGNRMLDLAPVARASLIEQLEDRLIVLDSDTRVIDTNRAALTTLGLSASAILGKTAAVAFAPWPDLLALINRPNHEPAEFRLGSVIFEVSVINVPGAVGEPARARILILRDITRRIDIENQLRLAKESAEAADQAQSRFLATMSHEIRTPMNGVVGFTQLLQETDLTSAQREYVDIIEQSSRSLLVIINDVLDYSKIAAGRLEIERMRCNPSEVAHQVCHLLKNRALEKNITLSCNVAPDAPSLVISDPVRLGQILVNLVGNAIKFTETGTVMLSLNATPREGGHLLILTILDTGIGISPEQHAHIFHPFLQGDATTTRRFGGTGLGLAITRNLCELMGGSLTMTSHPGAGSAFTATIDTDLFTEDTSAPISAQAPVALPVRDVSLNVLVFEDNLVNQAVMRALLHRLGHHPRFVANGQEGLQLLTTKTFDALLMDIEMPVMDGYETVRRIRAREASGEPRQHIIAVTAHALTGVRERCLAASMDDFLTKPVSLPILREALARVPIIIPSS